jgi:O-acetyl-ADP-ribose deacetylase (regulator of RNase III)
MIRFTTGNLLDASAEALVNTVNEVGVMGKGIALMFKERFPQNTREYTAASTAKHVKVGQMLVTETGELQPRWIINFPTKRHWRHPSKLEWIDAGLHDFVRVVRELGVKSVALPPLGCGNGGLAWSSVRPLIEAAAQALPDVDVLVFEPTDAYFTVQKAEGVELLTVPRALVVELVRRYVALGADCTILEIQKLAYFLDRSIRRLQLPDVLDLRFAADKFGPYADRLRHLLNSLDGSFLHAQKRLADAGPLDLIRLEPSKLSSLQDFLTSDEASRYAAAVDEATSLIDGFESPFGMELLGTVDWLLSEQHVPPEVGPVRAALASWPAGAEAASRKLTMFDARVVQLALDRLAPVAV